MDNKAAKTVAFENGHVVARQTSKALEAAGKADNDTV